jgi:hypothetical protein
MKQMPARTSAATSMFLSETDSQGNNQGVSPNLPIGVALAQVPAPDSNP